MTELSSAVYPRVRPARRATSWWKVLIIGTVLYVAGLVVLILTANTNLFPTVVAVGSFLVPVVYVAFFFEHRRFGTANMPSTALSLIYGGLLGVIAASVLEQRIVANQVSVATFFEVGLIEEFVKILGVLIVAWRWQHESEFDGLVLGAAAGMGFAAFESMGYAFNNLITNVVHSGGGNLAAIVLQMANVEFVRGILSPLGHGTWTAILAAVLFRESECVRFFRVTWRVVVAYLVVVVLHAAWDVVGDVLGAGNLPGIVLFLGQAAVGLPGLFLLRRRWKESIRQQVMAEVEAEAEVAQAEAAAAAEMAGAEAAVATGPVESLSEEPGTGQTDS